MWKQNILWKISKNDWKKWDDIKRENATNYVRLRITLWRLHPIMNKLVLNKAGREYMGKVKMHAVYNRIFYFTSFSSPLFQLRPLFRWYSMILRALCSLEQHCENTRVMWRRTLRIKNRPGNQSHVSWYRIV